MSDGRVVLMLTLLLGILPITTDLYLPTLPGLAQGFGIDAGPAQLTLSVLVLCFGLGQLATGPLSDRYGRRPVLLAGLGLYTAAGLAAALAPTLAWLVAARALQGLGMAASVTCARSLVRDLHAPAEGARVLSRALTGLGLIAFASPVTGGLVAATLGWRGAMAVLVLFGAATFTFVAWRLRETLPAPDLQALQPRHWLRNGATVLAHPGFRAWALVGAASYAGLFTMLALSPFVFIGQFGLGHAAYGLALASYSCAYMAGTVWCRRLLPRHGLRGATALAGALSLGGGLSMVVLSMSGVEQAWALVVPQWCYMLGHGIVQPCAQVGAVGPFPDKAGVAAALSGFAMTAAAFLTGAVLGQLGAQGSRPLALTVGLAGVAVAATAWTGVRRHGDCGAPAAARAAA